MTAMQGWRKQAIGSRSCQFLGLRSFSKPQHNAVNDSRRGVGVFCVEVFCVEVFCVEVFCVEVFCVEVFCVEVFCVEVFCDARF
ncbi:hypothetical protein BU23DRAFT_193047 [Bimuria novae-zelandiae CBS 107.79]|uniref:Uncharacterized protein n=1 Tax=Bimuria novae-zelandiae CBS 107.79 TaxID=1447943 RepID=A0A6A5VVW5_9PLEO|nr:hypothetical protein BU23DRAFT_193047 [Bimuria novae-zelandiae CBS 107.79]